MSNSSDESRLIVAHVLHAPRTAASGVLAASIGLSLLSGGAALSVLEEGAIHPVAEVQITNKDSQYRVVSVAGEEKTELLVSELGWTQAQIEAAHERYQPIKEFWDAPGMDAYDAL